MTTRLLEGGNAMSTPAIVRANVMPTISRYVAEVLNSIPHQKFTTLGSTGKKDKNGDIDIGLQTALSLDEIAGILKDLGFVDSKTSADAPRRFMVSRGLGEICTSFPQYDSNDEPTGELVQVDLMVGDLDWLQFMYDAPEQGRSEYKPMVRTALLYGLLRVVGKKEQIDENTIVQWSMANTRGMMKQKSTRRINRNGKEVFDKETLTDYVADPNLYCEIVFDNALSPDDLKGGFEAVWAKVKSVLDEESLRQVAEYVIKYCKDYDIPTVPTYILNESAKRANLRENVKILFEAVEGLIVDERNHGTHAEDMVLYGKEGIEFALHTYEELFDELKGNTPQNRKNVTIKIDGAPVAIMGMSFAGINKPFVASKAFIGEKEANEGAPYATDEESLQRLYGDRPGLLIKMRTLLNLVPRLGLKPGEAWRGDFLFGPRADGTKSVQIIEEDGEKLYMFHPNAIRYTVPVDSEAGRKVATAELGVAWHTRYTGPSIVTAAPDFSVSASELNDIPEMFALDHRLDNLAGVVTLTKEETDYMEQSIPVCWELANELVSDPLYSEIVGDEDFIHKFFTTFQNSFIRSKIQMDPAEFVDGLINWIKGKYEKEIGKLKKDAAIQSRQALMAQYEAKVEKWRLVLDLMVELMVNMSNVKSIFVKKLDAMGNLGASVHFLSTDEVRKTGQEGYVISDVNGNSIKLIDRNEFTTLAFDKDIEKGWQTERDVGGLQEAVLQEKEISTVNDVKKIMTTKKLKLKPGVEMTPAKRTYTLYGDFSATAPERFETAKKIAKEWDGKLIRGGKDVVSGEFTLQIKPAGALAGNKGHALEDKVRANIHDYPKVMDILKERFGYDPDDIVNVIHVGAANNARTVTWDLLPKHFYSSPSGLNPKDFVGIGIKLADVLLEMSDGKKIPVSIKSGKTVNFINCGLGQHKKINITNLLEAIGGVDVKKVFRGWSLYNTAHPSTQFQEETVAAAVLYEPWGEVNISLISEFLHHAIGQDYIMIHDDDIYYIDADVRKRFCRNLKVDSVQYPDKAHKTFQMNMETAGLTFSLQLRNRKGYNFPDSLLVPYKEKDTHA